MPRDFKPRITAYSMGLGLGALLVSTGLVVDAGELVAHWGMEQVQDGVLVDGSGSGHNGAYAGKALPEVVDGRLGNALAFDEKAEGYFTVAKSGDCHLPDGLTVMAWIRPAERSDTGEILCMKGDKSGDPPWPGWRFRYFWSRVTFEFGTTDGRQFRVSSPEWSTPTGFWSHVAAVYDGHTVRIYVNAVLAAEEPVEGVMAERKAPLIVANYVGRKNAYPFHGVLDEVKVFAGCLTQEAIFAEAAGARVQESSEEGAVNAALAPALRRTHTEAVESSRHTYQIRLGGHLDAENTLTWRPIHGRSTMEWGLFQPNLSVTVENVGRTDVHSAWLAVNGRDWYSIDAMLDTITEPDMTDRERTFAVYELFKNNFYHYNVAECRLDEEGYLVSDVLDPVKMFNCYENNGCSLHAINVATLWRRLGLDARVINFKSTHWYSEVFYDGAWHMMDADARVFFPKHDNETIACMDDWARDRYLLKRAHHKGDFARADVAADLDHATHYADENTGTPFRAQSGHCMDIDLRPGEKIVYRWDNIGKFHDNWRHKEYVPKYANGRFVYAPDFTKPYAARGAASCTNVTGFGSETGRLTLEDAAQPGELMYRFASPYVLVGGAVALVYEVGEGGELGLDVSFDGQTWVPLWAGEATEGENVIPAKAGRDAEVSLDEAIAPRSTDAKYVYWLRYRFKAAVLHGMTVTSDFEASVNALPALRVGVNEIAYRDAAAEPHQVRITHEWQECSSLLPPPTPIPAALENAETLGPLLRWTQPEHPQGRIITHGRIQVRADPKMRVAVSPNLERVFQTGVPEWQTPNGWLLPEKTYYWRVRTRDEAGIWSPWSEVATFALNGPGLVLDVRVEDTTLLWAPPALGSAQAHYEVFGADEAGFVPSPENRLVTVEAAEWPIALTGARRYYRVRAMDAHGTAGPVSASAEASGVRSRLYEALRAGENLARKAEVEATRTVDSYTVEAAVDGDAKTLWAGGRGQDLRLQPADYFLDWGDVAIVDTVILTTDRLKNQLRLVTFAIYAWAGDDWDGAPVFEMEGNKEDVVVCRFPAVETSRLCIRCLDTARADHSFVHLNEIEVYGSAEALERALSPSGLPPATTSLTHDLAALERQVEALGKGSAVERARAEFIAQRRPFLVEAEEWKQKLQAETERTQTLTKAGAPAWAVALRDALSRYRLWVHWWSAHQREDGQFGGQYGDDVELCCGWPVLCLAQDDRTTFDALKRLADGLWENIPSVKQFGYDRYSDVEHSAEPTSYSQPRMAVLDWPNPLYVERCRQTFETVYSEWMGVNQRGDLQFKSAWFGYDKAMKPRVNPDAMYDVPECAKALKPGLYVAWATGDEDVKQKLVAYGRTWAKAALAEYEGKPKGLFPARIHWDSGAPEGVHTRFPPMRAMYFHLLACYRWTGDATFLEPIADMLRLFVVDGAVNDIPAACGYRAQDGKECGLCLSQLALAASLWRRLSGDRSLDPHFERWIRKMSDSLPDGHKTFFMLDRNRPDLWLPDEPAPGAYKLSRYALGTPFYLGWEVTGDKRFLALACRNLSEDLTDMWGPLTYWFYDKTEPRVISNDHSAHSIQWAAFALCLMTTGGPGPIEAPYPSMAVTWKGANEDFVPLVLERDASHLVCLLYNFGPEPADITPRFWELAAGSYRLLLRKVVDEDGQPGEQVAEARFDVDGPTEARFALPPGGPHVLTVDR